MHKLYYLLLTSFFSIGLLSAQTNLSDKRPSMPKNKGAYQRYEATDMGIFRKHSLFSKPILKEEEVILTVEDTLNRYRKVEGFFKGKNVYYVEANPNLEKLSQKHPKPVVQTAAPVPVIETPIYTPVLATTTSSAPRKKAAPIKARGYRVQLFNGQDREQANRIKNQFISFFPEVPRYLIFVEPTFRVRVGDFYTKTEADNFLKEVKKLPAFSDAIVIRDIVEFREKEDPVEEDTKTEN